MKKVVHLNKGRSEKRALVSETNKVFKQLKTTHERYADVFRKLGYNLDISNPEFPPKKELISEILEITGEKNDKWIGVAPFSQYDSKNYPLDLLEKVIEQLSEKENIKILLFGGGKKEVEILTGIENKYKNTINIAGKIRIKQEIKLISNLDCMLSMDSGNGHFAAMLGVKVVTLWGATHPFTGFAPYNQPVEYCIVPDLEKYPKLPSSIYGNKVLEGYENAMRSIQPESVTKIVLGVLS